MKTGMLWFDDNPRTDTATKVLAAADYYRLKYGQVPDLCLLHPGAPLPPGPLEFGGGQITIRGNRSVLPGHLWIGVDDHD